MALAAGIALLACTNTNADSFEFTKLSNNAPDDLSGQLKLEVADFGGEACFSFSNIGPISSSIAEIFFDDAPPGSGNDLGYLGTISMITGNAGDWQAYKGSPSDLPGGNTATPPFTTDGDPIQYATANNPAPKNGINVGESLNIYFSYKNGGTIADVLADLTSGALRVGLHVTGIGQYSDSYITGGSKVSVPDDGATLVLLGLGLSVLLLGAVRFKQATA